jgi:hypothetical protein
MEEQQTCIILVWVEAMGEMIKEKYDTGMTREAWDAMTDEERNAHVEDWAYNEVQMGFGWEPLEG